MKLLPVVFASFTILSSVVSAQQPPEKSYSFPVSDPTNPVMLDVNIRHGRIIVEGSDTDQVEIIAKTRLLNDEEMKQIKKHKQKYWKKDKGESKTPRSREGLTPVKSAMLNLAIDQNGNRFDIASDESTYYVEMVISVPVLTNVEAGTYRGDGISINNLNGYMELATWQGDIVAEAISGPVVAETHQNAIIVNFSTFSNDSPSSFTTHSGDIDITIDPKEAATINVRNYQGEILSGLDVEFTATEQVNRREGNDKQEIVIGGQLTATLNQGGQEMTLSTYNGDVYLRKAGQ
jgi:hypothetical protein